MVGVGVGVVVGEGYRIAWRVIVSYNHISYQVKLAVQRDRDSYIYFIAMEWLYNNKCLFQKISMGKQFFNI